MRVIDRHRALLWLSSGLFLVLAARVSSADDATEAIAEHEKPFRASAQAFVDAYAERDAKAIGELFTEDAEFYDEDGNRTAGREAIAAMFADEFEAAPEALVEEIDVQRVRMIKEDVALEEGLVAATGRPGGPRRISRYVAIHVRGRDGVWRINTVKDYAEERNSRIERLAELSWMLGEWVSEDPETVVHVDGRWSEDGNYLLREFTVHFTGRPVMNGTQRIGWDPVRREIRSWTFDSDGGHVAGTWKRSGDQWLAVSSGYTADGESATGLAVYTLHDAERITWQHRSLLIGNELRTDVEPVVLTRRAPAPATAAAAE